MDTLDLVIVGAGLSGINLAHHVAENFPSWRWQILEGRDDLGGTWHTFRYPGIRSDSDMATFAFPFRDWTGTSTLGDGADIKEYLRATAEADGTLEHLRTNSYVENIDWDSNARVWRLTVRGGEAADGTAGDGQEVLTARRVHLATGYYDHDRGFRPSFPNEADFRGDIIHPQQWPEDYDATGKNIVVIGSGATAVTLIPALADDGAHVTMLQRSPTWIAPLSEKDRISAFWGTVLPGKLGGRLARRAARTTHAVRDEMQYLLSQHAPWATRLFLRALQRRHLPADVIDQHFTPDYRPWDQRVCKAPDGDIFDAIADGRADVVTDTITRFVPDGIELSSGRILPDDTIVTATGLELLAFGGATISVDGEPLNISELLTYRGALFAGLPNLSFTIGYLNASWTLRSDLVARYLVDLWQRGDKFYAPIEPAGQTYGPLMEFDSGYIRRGQHRLPRQGDTGPWRYHQNYLTEWAQFTGRDAYEDMALGEAALVNVNKPKPAAHPLTSSGTHTPTDLSALPDTMRIDVGGRSVRVRMSQPGRTDAPTVVLVHGIGRSLEDFDDQVALWGHRARLIAIDLPGFGLSDPVATRKIPEMARHLWATVDAMIAEGLIDENQPIHLLGNSLGGATTIEMTAQQPARVASLGLIAPAGFGERANPLLRVLALPRIGKMAVALSPLPVVYRPIEHLILRRPGSVTKHRVQVAREMARHPARSETYYQLCRNLGTWGGISEEWREAVQRRFADAMHKRGAGAGAGAGTGALPIFLCWGRYDKILPIADFRVAVAAMQPDVAVVFEDCGHMPQLEDPEQLAAQYQEFLTKVVGIKV